MGEFLIRGEGRFDAFLDGSCFDAKGTAWTPRRLETLATVITALISGDDRRLPEIEPLRDLYADLHPTSQTLNEHPLVSVDDAFRRCDPLAVRLELRGRNAGERWFLRQGLAYIAESDCRRVVAGSRTPADTPFARLFWQTIRVRCLYYRTVVQRPLTGGLQWFIRFYGRLGELRNPLNPIRPQVSYDNAGDHDQHRIRASNSAPASATAP